MQLTSNCLPAFPEASDDIAESCKEAANGTMSDAIILELISGWFVDLGSRRHTMQALQ